MKRFLLLILVLFTALQSFAQMPWHHHYADERAIVRKNGRYGFTNRQGTEVIPCQYDKAYAFNDDELSFHFKFRGA